MNKLDREKKRIRDRIREGAEKSKESSEGLSKRIRKSAKVSRWGFKETDDREGGEDTDK